METGSKNEMVPILEAKEGIIVGAMESLSSVGVHSTISFAEDCQPGT